MDIKTMLTILHLFGAVLGAGGAFVSDFMFLKSVKDEKISETEIGFLQLGGKIVWAGLFVLAASGMGLYFLDTNHYLASSKFLAKMTIVGVIIANGVVVHVMHIPRMIRHAGHHFPSSDEFMRKRVFLLMSGAVSSVSWSLALILGTLQRIPYSYTEIISVYAAIVCTAALAALFLKENLLPSHRKQ